MAPDVHPVDVVVQGASGAAEVLYGLHAAFDERSFHTIVRYLAAHGPRGSSLHARYVERAGSDALVLGRDLLAQASESEGWSD